MYNKEKIKVSVCVVTYNQEKYIAECLQSLVDQVTDFPFEIIVGEDCSTDRTREIVEEFALKYPGLIVRNYHDENVGAVENIIKTYRVAKGKYICHMDGDDYALPGKLKEQVMALDKNPGCVICSHDMVQIEKNGNLVRSSFRAKESGVYKLLDLYKDLPFFAHSSKIFVNDLDASYWSQLNKNALDIEIHVEQAKRGDIYHINEVLGAYRLKTGVSGSFQNVNPLLLEGTERVFDSALSSGTFNRSLLEHYYAKSMFKYAYQSAVFGDKKGMKVYIKKSISLSVFSIPQLVFYILSYSPGFAVLLASFRAKLKGYK